MTNWPPRPCALQLPTSNFCVHGLILYVQSGASESDPCGYFCQSADGEQLSASKPPASPPFDVNEPPPMLVWPSFATNHVRNPYAVLPSSKVGWVCLYTQSAPITRLPLHTPWWINRLPSRAMSPSVALHEYANTEPPQLESVMPISSNRNFFASAAVLLPSRCASCEIARS